MYISNQWDQNKGEWKSPPIWSDVDTEKQKNEINDQTIAKLMAMSQSAS